MKLMTRPLSQLFLAIVKFVKIAILVAYKDLSPFREIRNARIRQQTVKTQNCSFEIFYVSGRAATRRVAKFSSFIERKRFTRLGLFLRVIDSLLLFRLRFAVPKIKLEGKNLQVDCPDELRFLGAKMLSAYKYCLDQKFDYVFKTTVSSIIVLDNLDSYLVKSIHKPYVYSGKLINPQYKTFASGSCLLMDQVALQRLWKKRFFLDYSLLDDVAIGKVMRKVGIQVSDLASISLTQVNQVKDLDLKELSETLHFRCKSDETPRADIQIIQALIKRLESVRCVYI